VGVFGTDEPARAKAAELAALGYASTARCIGSDAACIDLSPPSESRWTVRVHRAATLSQAKALASLFVPRFGDVFVGRIVERMPDGGQWFVDVGLPITRAEAETLAEKVRTDGAVADAVVVCRSAASTDCA
jgi:hypothetical protein